MRTSAHRGPIRKGPFFEESSPKWLLFSHYLRIRPANHGLVWLALRRTWEGLVCARLIRGLALGKPWLRIFLCTRNLGNWRSHAAHSSIGYSSPRQAEGFEI